MYYRRNEMTSEEELNIEFDAAVERVNDHTEPFPADFLLQIGRAHV